MLLRLKFLRYSFKIYHLSFGILRYSGVYYRHMRRILLTIFFLFAPLFLPSFVSAQVGEFRMITSPLPINLVAEPGTSVSSPIKVKNDGSAEERIKIDLMKFAAFGENGAPRLLDPEPNDDFISWASFSEKEFSIAPGEWKTITATFTVPQSAAFGYYYAVVFSRAGDPLRPKDGQTGLAGGTAVLVLLEAKVPNAKRDAEVVEFHADKKWYEFLPASFTVRVKNTGTVHIAPRGNIFVGREGEEQTSTLSVNSEKGNILPNSFREFTAEWTDGFPAYREKMENGKGVRDGEGNVVRELVWDWKEASKFRWGKYQAKLLLIYDDGKRDVPIEGTVDFWVLPWKIMLAVGVVLILLFAGLWSLVSKVWRGIFRRKKSSEN